MTGPPPRLLLVVKEVPGLGEAVRKRLPGVPFAFLSEAGPTGLADVEAALVGSMFREAAKWDPAAHPHLRFIQRIFAGVNDLPFDRIPAGVAIAGNVGGYDPFVAEQALALALACARCLLAGSAAVAADRSRPAPELRTLWREPVMILGAGSIGRAIADRLRPFEARISGLNRTGSPVEGFGTMFSAGRLREAVADAAYVFDARPLTRATARSLGKAEFEAMREDATVVNVGRGGTIDQEALYRHLVTHPRFRAGIDVWWDEDFAKGSLGARFPFSELPNFVGSPHWGGFAPGVEEYALAKALDNLARFFAGEPPLHVVDRSEYAGLRGGTG